MADKDPKFMTPEERRRKPKVWREDTALQMRLAGGSYERINQAFGYKRTSTIERLIQGALNRRVDEEADQIRTMDIDRMDRMLSALWPQCLMGDQGAIKTAIRLLQHKSRIVPGLEAPSRHAGFDGGPIKIEQQHAAQEELRGKLISLADRKREKAVS